MTAYHPYTTRFHEVNRKNFKYNNCKLKELENTRMLFTWKYNRLTKVNCVFFAAYFDFHSNETFGVF